MLEAQQSQPQSASPTASVGVGAVGVPAPAAVPPYASSGNLSTPLQMPGMGQPGAPKQGLDKINVQEKTQSFSAFLFGVSLALVVLSLVGMAFKSQKTAAVSQLNQEYNTTIKTRLNDKIFKDQEKQVKAIGDQVTVLKTSLNDRVMFSKFFAELEKVTYKKATFDSISANKDNSVSLSGTVADYYDVSKTQQALKTSTVFKSVELASLDMDKEKKTVKMKFNIKLDPSLLKPPGASTTPQMSGPGGASGSPGETDTTGSSAPNANTQAPTVSAGSSSAPPASSGSAIPATGSPSPTASSPGT